MEGQKTSGETDLLHGLHTLLLHQAVYTALAFWRVLRPKSAWMYLIAPEITPTSHIKANVVGGAETRRSERRLAHGGAHARTQGGQETRQACQRSRRGRLRVIHGRHEKQQQQVFV